jgi:DNA-binding transcriptional regulator YhcF (GntR family)
MAEFPIRKLSRLGNEMHLSAVRAVHDLADGQHDWGIVALLLMSRCVPDWIVGNEFRRPVSLTHAVSLRAMAHSFRIPYASAHRHMVGLRQRGWVMDTGDGFAISNDDQHADRMIAFLTTAHDCLIRLIEDLSPHCVFPPAQHSPTPDLFRSIVATALDIWLIPFEVAREPVTNWTSKLVAIAIAIANVRHITVDAVASERYAWTPTRDALRRPITARSIAALTGLTYGTTYRHCQALAQRDVIEYDRGGWLIASRQLHHASMDHGVKAILSYYNKRIGELAALGLDVSQVQRLYVAGRPPYVPL